MPTGEAPHQLGFALALILSLAFGEIGGGEPVGSRSDVDEPEALAGSP